MILEKNIHIRIRPVLNLDFKRLVFRYLTMSLLQFKISLGQRFL